MRLPGRYKAALWIIALFLLWRASQSAAIVEPLFLFLTAGAVPGTAIRLSPDTILTALPFVFAGVVVLIFHREFWRLGRSIVNAFRRKPPTPSIPASATGRAPHQPVEPDEPTPSEAPTETPEVAKSPEPAPSLSASAKPALETTSMPRSVRVAWAAKIAVVKALLGRFSRWLQLSAKRVRLYTYAFARRLLVKLLPFLDATAYRIGFALGWLERYGAIAWRATQRFVRFAWKVIRIESRYAAKRAAYHAARLWVWLSPYLWRLDAWLGVQLNAFLRHPYVRHARHVVRDAKDTIIRLIKK